MLSIIVCSRTEKLSDSFSSNIEETVGVEFELLCIDNSKNEFSIAQAYNEGKLRSKFDYLCFIHDDVHFNTQDWGVKVINHLNNSRTGFIGLAGGDVALKVLYDYGALNLSVNIIHVDKSGVEPTEYVHYPVHYSGLTRSVVLLDGVFLCAKKEIFEKIAFDNKLGRFHGYDYDISLQSITAGYKNFVVYDISLTHYSKGNFDIVYYSSILKVVEKWKAKLPIFESSIPQIDQKHKIIRLEKKSLNKLLKKLIRQRMKPKHVAAIYSYYAKLIGSRTDILMLKMLRLRINFVLFTSVLRNK